MAGSTITRIIEKAYGRRYNLDSRELAIKPRYHLTPGDYLHRWYTFLLDFFRNRWLLITLAAAVFLFFVISIYYYNLLVKTEQDVLKADAKVSALMQRRNDISINLSKAVFDYSKHEHNVMVAIVALRSILSMEGEKDQILQKIQKSIGKPDSPIASDQTASDQAASGQAASGQAASGQAVSGQAASDPAVSGKAEVLAPKTMDQALAANPLSALKKISAVAEQYPDLKLSTTFISLMTALIDVEKDLAAERFNYNDAVNMYTTKVIMFPSNIYAKLFNFPDKSYFESTQAAKSLEPIKY